MRRLGFTRNPSDQIDVKAAILTGSRRQPSLRQAYLGAMESHGISVKHQAGGGQFSGLSANRPVDQVDCRRSFRSARQPRQMGFARYIPGKKLLSDWQPGGCDHSVARDAFDRGVQTPFGGPRVSRRRVSEFRRAPLGGHKRPVLEFHLCGREQQMAADYAERFVVKQYIRRIEIPFERRVLEWALQSAFEFEIAENLRLEGFDRFPDLFDRIGDGLQLLGVFRGERKTKIGGSVP